MRARTYFEARGRRHRSLGYPYHNPYTLGFPYWVQEAYRFGYTYQESKR